MCDLKLRDSEPEEWDFICAVGACVLALSSHTGQENFQGQAMEERTGARNDTSGQWQRHFSDTICTYTLQDTLEKIQAASWNMGLEILGLHTRVCNQRTHFALFPSKSFHPLREKCERTRWRDARQRDKRDTIGVILVLNNKVGVETELLCLRNDRLGQLKTQ